MFRERGSIRPYNWQMRPSELSHEAYQFRLILPCVNFLFTR